MKIAMQWNENLEITLNQVIEDAHVTILTIAKKTEVLVTSSSHSSDLASKFLKFSDIPHTDAEIVSPMVVHVHHEVPSNQTTTLLTVLVSVITESSPILPKEVSNFAPPLIKSMVTESLEHEVLAKESSQPKSSYEVAASLTEFELKKILIDKMDVSQSYLTATKHRECYDGLIKSYDLDKSLFSTYDKVYSLKRSRKDKDKDEDLSAGPDRGLKKRKTSKDDEPTKGLKAKEVKSGSSKGTKSITNSLENSIQERDQSLVFADLRNAHKINKKIQVRYLKNPRERVFLNVIGLPNQNHLKNALILIGMLNRLTNLSGDDVSDFAIALRMFTRSMVIQKESKIFNWESKVTRIRSTSPSQKLPNPASGKGTHTLHIKTLKDSFMLTTKGEIDITKNIQMEYLPKRKWSSLENKRAHIMIKAIDKLLKERMMMRNLEKFVGIHNEDGNPSGVNIKQHCDEDLIEKILSGSTFLESLELKDCYGYRRIDVTSKSVKKLVFLEYNSDAAYEEDYIDCIKINAPYIVTNYKRVFVIFDEEVFRGLLKSLGHFEDITLGDHCLELLSRLKAGSDTSNDDRAKKRDRGEQIASSD
ncbi:hypothetical protein Tco_0116626 [Tanacetum coccineum]